MTIYNDKFNGHLELETLKNPGRSYFTILQNSHPQFSVDNLRAEIQVEAEYWMMMFAGKDGKSFLEVFEGVGHIFDALKHEGGALKDVERAMSAHERADWGEASNYYIRAISDLYNAVSAWGFAMHDIAGDTPFDPYYPQRAERQKHIIEEPPRASYHEMCEVSPLLLRILRNLDRLFCTGQELVQRQMTCLAIYMQKAEEAQQQVANNTITEIE